MKATRRIVAILLLSLGILVAALGTYVELKPGRGPKYEPPEPPRPADLTLHRDTGMVQYSDGTQISLTDAAREVLTGNIKLLSATVNNNGDIEFWVRRQHWRPLLTPVEPPNQWELIEQEIEFIYNPDGETLEMTQLTRIPLVFDEVDAVPPMIGLPSARWQIRYGRIHPLGVWKEISPTTPGEGED
jgi:hypothetical protein